MSLPLLFTVKQQLLQLLLHRLVRRLLLQLLRRKLHFLLPS